MIIILVFIMLVTAFFMGRECGIQESSFVIGDILRNSKNLEEAINKITKKG